MIKKVIFCDLCNCVNRGTEEEPVWEEVLYPVKMDWNEANEEIARREAHNGEYSVVEEAQEASETAETVDDVLDTVLGVTE